MKKYIFFLLLFAFVTGVSHSQEMPDGEIVCSEGEIKGITTINTWTNHNLKYYIQNYASHGLTNYQCLTAIQNAFNKWSQYSDFTFTRTYSSSLADIIIKWVTDSDNCGLHYPTAKAHSTQGETTGTPPGFIHFNDDFTFTMTSSGNNLEAIALREIGHLLGLPYVSITSAVMYVDNVQTLNLTGYDLNPFYILYAFPGILSGPKLVNSSGEYVITSFPSGLTTTWSVDDSHYNNTSYLKGNQNGYGTCTIDRNPNYDLTNATLTAYIKKGSINVYTLDMQPIYAYEGFKGSYTSGNLSGSIPYTYFFNIKANATTYIKSANFFGATVTYGSSGATPSIWTFSPTYGDLTFVTSNTSAPVIINVHDVCGNNYTLYAYASSYYSINVSNGEGGITVTLVEDGDASKDFTLDEPWTIEIINAATGQVMATQSSTSRSETISTAGWPKGIYVVKVTIGKEELTEKVMIK
jgi:hypothetical protein